MPFPKNHVHFCVFGGTSPREERATDPASGVVSVKLVECNKPLPSAELFDVAAMVAAGVTLNPVNTQVICDTPAQINEGVQAAITAAETKSKQTKFNNSNTQ